MQFNRSKWCELGLIFCCFMLALFPPFAAEWLNDFSGVYYLYENRNAYGLDTSLIIVLIALALACATQSLGHWQRAGFAFTITLLVLLGVFATAHVVLYVAPISVGAIDALLGTDVHEALEYLSFQWSPLLAVTTGGYLALFVTSLWWVRPRLSVERHAFSSQGIAWPVVLGLVLATYQHPAVAVQNKSGVEQLAFWSRVHGLNSQVPSLRIIGNVSEWIDYRDWLRASQAKRAEYSFNATLDIQQPRTVVLVLGESVRRSNLSLYGYNKSTTPHLDARRDELLIFNRAIAPANQTVPSITKMLSPATVLDPDKFLLQPSIITAAKQAGYHTYWLSNQGRVGQFDSKISLIAQDADTSVYTNTEFYGSIFDTQLLHPVDVALQDPHPYKLIVVHMQGSHQSYENRYPSEYNVFKGDQYPATTLTRKQNDVLAAYDNSIRYSDKMLDSIFTQLEKQPGSILLFVSDHGERFYENGVNSAGHGYPKPTKLEFDVPYFLWCNGGCNAAWRSTAAKHRDIAFSTENLFHTGINLLGLRMQDYQAKADILNMQYQARTPQIINTERRVINYQALP